jgi:thiol-disulfide isomerase/thioredoxin
MRLAAATLLLTLSGTTLLADDTPSLKAGLRPADDKKPAEKKADDKKADGEKKSDTTPARKKPTREERFKAAKDGYQAQCASWVDTYRHEDEPKGKEMLLKYLPNPAFYAGQAARLVLEDPKDDVAFDALTWLLRYQSVPEVQKVLMAVQPAERGGKTGALDVTAALVEHHIDNPKLADMARGIYQYSPENVKFLRAVYSKATDPKIRGFAGAQLGDLFNRKSENPDLTNAERVKLLSDAEAVYAALVEDKDVGKVVLYKTRDGKEKTLGDNLPGDLREVRELSVGKTLPALVGRDLDDKTAKASDYKGKVLVLDLWATWCGPCKAMIPHEREMVERLKNKPFALVSVSCDKEKKTLTAFLEKESMPWAHWWDGDQGDVSKGVNLHFYPTIYVIDAKGTIRFKNIRGEKLEAAVNKLLKEIDGDKGAASSGGQ